MSAGKIAKIAASASRQTNAVVISAGLMEKTVKVRVGVLKWNSYIGKHFNQSRNILVHDPRSSLRIGDIVSISPGWRVSKHVHHVVKSIVAPFGEPIEARPPIPSEEERIAEREAKRAAKAERKRLRMMELRGERVAVEGGEEALGGQGGREKEEVQTL